MPVIIPELELTYLEGTNPRHYALNIKIDGEQAHPNLMISDDGGAMTDPNDLFSVTVQMGSENTGRTEIDVDMGQHEFDSGESLVEVKLMQNNSTIGEGSIRVEEAQQESKPIGENF